jgi:hypothetical protein
VHLLGKAKVVAVEVDRVVDIVNGVTNADRGHDRSPFCQAEHATP